MWGQLGNSALGSNTLRSSLSENNIPSIFKKRSPAGDRAVFYSKVSDTSLVVATHRRVHPPSPIPNQPPSYPPPPIPSSPSPSSLSAASSSASSGHSSFDLDTHPLRQRDVERHVGGRGEKDRDQKLSTTEGESVSSRTESSTISGGTTRKRETSASETESSGDDDPTGLLQRGGYGRNSLLRSGRCISMPSIVTSQVVTVAISPPVTPPPVLRKVVKNGKKTKTKKTSLEETARAKSRASSAASPSPIDDSGVYNLDGTRTPGEKTSTFFSSEANTPSSGIDVVTTVAATVKDSKEPTLTVPGNNGNSTRASSQPKRQRDNSQGSGGGGGGRVKEPSTNGGGSHERRFRRRFPQVGNDEDLIDHYSCALVADILLQGVLYISPNYFAFYSNIFGFKTQFLIPIQSVLKVTKEKTVKIIPNAVGIKTEGRKYVFGSLLSRDATFKTLLAVWSKVVDPEVISLIEDSETDNTSNAPAQQCSEEELEEFQGPKSVLTGLVSGKAELEDTEAGSSILSSSPTSLQFSPLDAKTQDLSVTQGKDPNSPVSSCHWYPGKELFLKVESICISFNKLPKTSLMLLISTFLLVLLFASASVLIFRIAIVHKRISSAEKTQPEWIYRLNAYHDIFKRQNQALSEEVTQLTDRLKETIDQLNKMRRPLEELFASSAFAQGGFCETSKGWRSASKYDKEVPQDVDRDAMIPKDAASAAAVEKSSSIQSLGLNEEEDDEPWIPNT